VIWVLCTVRRAPRILPPAICNQAAGICLRDDPVRRSACCAVRDTLKQADADGRVTATSRIVSRGFWQPTRRQMFRLGVLRQALADALACAP